MTDKPSEHASSLNEFLGQLNLVDLALFQKVAEELSISRGAQKMGDMPESTASKRLRRVEELLGSRLFERTTRKITLSDDGAAYLNQVDQLMGIVSEMYQLKTVLPTQKAGMLKVGGGGIFIDFLSREFLGRFMRDHPEIRMDIQRLPWELLEENVRNKDVIIMARLPDSQSIGLRHLGSFRLYFFSTARYLEEHGRPQHPRELPQHTFLTVRDKVFGSHCIPWQDADSTLYCEPLHHPFFCDSTTTIMNLLLQGFGIVCAPLVTVQDHLPELEVLFDGRYGADFDGYAILPSARLMPRKVEVFLDELQDYLKGQTHFLDTP